jgi:hypothetical protein
MWDQDSVVDGASINLRSGIFFALFSTSIVVWTKVGFGERERWRERERERERVPVR